jgi:phosphoribosylformimino-5-aminoimidazole carboxamide ribotide isomerase
MFRPCIDLHEGTVKQIVGGSLEEGKGTLKTNFVSERDSAWFAELYRKDDLRGGHVIMLGSGNEEAALNALSAFPGGLQVGGGIHAGNAVRYLDAGASHVIVTSWVFKDGRIEWDRLNKLLDLIGKEKLVLDLSCRMRDDRYWVVTDRWSQWTDFEVDSETLGSLSRYCDEFLVHAVDVEGLCRGIDTRLVALLGKGCPIPVTYAGGAKSLDDLKQVEDLGNGRVDLTIGSALDIFGGDGVKYTDAVGFNRSISLLKKQNNTQT